MLGKHIIRQFLTQVLGLFIGFFISIITTRILGPQGRGSFALILNTAALLGIVLNFSFAGAVIHVISTDKAPLRNTVNTVLAFICGVILFTLLLLLFFPFNKFDFVLPLEQGVFFCCTVLMCLFTTSLMGTLFNSVLNAKKLFRSQQIVYFFIAPLTLIAYLILYYFHLKDTLSFKTFIIFYMLVSAAPTIGAYLIYCKQARPAFSFSFLDKSQLKYISNMSFLMYLGNIFQFLSYRMDVWFVEYYSGTKDLGIYTLAVNLAQLLWMLPQTIATIFLSYSGSSKPQVAIDHTNSLCRIAINLILAITIFLASTIHFFIPLLYGREFTHSIILFQILLLGILPFCLTTIIASYFAGIGLAKINFYGSFIGFIACFAADLILIPLYGTTGAAFATVISYCISTFYTLVVYTKKTKSSLSDVIIIKKEDIHMLKNKLKLNFLFQQKN